ncbi:MAG: hypothetical protein H6741_30265 [Alphaproteobacteria bacterium]|nr:hypothetical protein [Alphaproteobacteria bacterium]
MHTPQHTRGLVIAHLWHGGLARPDEAVVVRLDREGADLRLSVAAPLHGDPPPPGPPGPTDRLWEHEVVELFLASEARPERYLEVELGPHGHHLVLQLDGVRRPTASGLAIRYRTLVQGDFWFGEAVVPAALLPEAPWRLNATAIHGQGAERRYLSWRALPGEQPDFHQPHRFAAFDDLNPR